MNSNLQHYLLSILGKKDYSEGELRFKSLAKNYTELEIEEVVNWLLARNFVNDQRLAENLVEKYSSSKGKIWINQKLQARKIPRELAQNVLNKNLSSFQMPNSTIKEKLARKYKIQNWAELDQNTKQKVVGFLARQGFSQVYQILESWSRNLDSTEDLAE